MTTLNYGIIGCGMMGHEHIKNIKLLENTNISVIFEPDEGMRVSASKQAPEADFVSSLEEVLDRTDLDCLVIVSPNFLHASQMQKIADTKHLPLLIEKPIVTMAGDEAVIEHMHACLLYTSPSPRDS